MSFEKQPAEKDTFESVYLKYHKKLFGFALRHLHNEALAEDLVHDAFVKLWHKGYLNCDDKQLQSYLFTIVKNIIVNHYRRRCTEARCLEELSRRPQESLSTSYGMLETIMKAIEKLPPRRKQIFKMSKLQGLTYREIAERLNISSNTVEVQMVEAHKSLRRMILGVGSFTIICAVMDWIALSHAELAQYFLP